MMTTSILVPPFEDFSSFFFNTDYVMLVKDNLPAISMLERGEEPGMKELMSSNRVRYFKNFTMMLKEACSNELRSAVFESTLMSLDDNLPCQLQSMKNRYFRAGYAAGVSKNFDGTEALNYGFVFIIKPNDHFAKTWVLDIYSQNVWGLTATFYVVLCTCSIFIQYLDNKCINDRKTISFIDHILAIYGVFCNQGGEFSNCSVTSHKVFQFCTVLLSWFLSTSFSLQIYVVMTTSLIVPPFEDFESFSKNTDYVILFWNNTGGINKHDEGRCGKASLGFGSDEVFKDIRSVLVEACSDHYKSVAFESDLLILDSDLPCQLQSSKRSYFNSWFAMGVSKNFDDMESMNRG
ncbi:hypothetical protein QAD02_016794 [Eretmocerus hayati]|uniref:Uncharacterized protein n=1 Tax=Eretmocerus hayati TaxID=131215 RepID=A0ACC2PCH3_9HYME|nr:hypothetical protein QAD02_016794 [Eretmocerus hayati]